MSDLNDRLRAMPSSLNDACRTMDEAADELAISQARGDLAVQNRNHWQQEAEALKARITELEKHLKSVSNQCGNVIYNCEQRPADNERHLSSWRGVKEYADAALNPRTGS